jgi:hypothetical protein
VFFTRARRPPPPPRLRVNLSAHLSDTKANENYNDLTRFFWTGSFGVSADFHELGAYELGLDVVG